MARSTIRDISVFTLGGTDLLSVFQSGEIDIMNQDDEGATATSQANSPQLVKKSATFRADLLSDVTSEGRVTNLHCTVLTIDGGAFIGDLTSGTLSIGYVADKDTSGVADKWMVPQNIRLGDVTLDCTLKIPTTAVQAFVTDAVSSTVVDAYMDITLTINGVAITMPFMLSKVNHSAQLDSAQEIKATWKLRDDGDAAIPNAPTGSTSLLEKAFNAYRTAVALVWTTKATGGRAYGGNFIFSSVNIAISQSAVVKTSYEFASASAVTAATT